MRAFLTYWKGIYSLKKNLCKIQLFTDVPFLSYGATWLIWLSCTSTLSLPSPSFTGSLQFLSSPPIPSFPFPFPNLIIYLPINSPPFTFFLGTPNSRMAIAEDSPILFVQTFTPCLVSFPQPFMFLSFIIIFFHPVHSSYWPSTFHTRFFIFTPIHLCKLPILQSFHMSKSSQSCVYKHCSKTLNSLTSSILLPPRTISNPVPTGYLSL